MIDALGSPIEEGSLVLTAGYWTSRMSVITKVKKVTDKHVYVEIPAIWWCRETITRKYGDKIIRRQAQQVIVIDKQLKYNRKKYPEYAI